MMDLRLSTIGRCLGRNIFTSLSKAGFGDGPRFCGTLDFFFAWSPVLKQKKVIGHFRGPHKRLGQNGPVAPPPIKGPGNLLTPIIGPTIFFFFLKVKSSGISYRLEKKNPCYVPAYSKCFPGPLRARTALKNRHRQTY